MFLQRTVGVVIPALNEESAISLVVQDLRELKAGGLEVVDHIVVCDNGSTDRTAEIAATSGAHVVVESRRGYGSACLRALHELQSHNVDLVVFCDGDHAFEANELPAMLNLLAEGVDLVVGSRVLGRLEPGALTRSQRVGNWVATTLMRWIWGQRMTDLGPYRAITASALKSLQMVDPAYGWTVEMQVKAMIQKLKVAEVPVSTRVRVGTSKISGTLKGAVGAGVGILGMILRLWWQHRRI